MANPYPIQILDGANELERVAGYATFTDPSNQPGSSPDIAYVTDAAAPPGGAFVTPLVFDHTASTGGLYAWDGSAYLKVGLATT